MICSMLTSSVRVKLPTGTAAPLSLTPTAGTYAGQIDIAAIPVGASSFTVEASDVSGRTARRTVSFVHDPGPIVTFVLPTAPTAKGSLNVEILVEDPLHPITSAAAVKGTIRQAGDIPFQVVSAGPPLQLTALLTFASFSPPLEGEQARPDVVEQLARDPADIMRVAELPDYALAVPTPDHFIPLLYLAGLAAAEGAPLDALVRGYTMGSISMTCYGLGAKGILQKHPECAARLPPEVPPDQTNM